MRSGPLGAPTLPHLPHLPTGPTLRSPLATKFRTLRCAPGTLGPPPRAPHTIHVSRRPHPARAVGLASHRPPLTPPPLGSHRCHVAPTGRYVTTQPVRGIPLTRHHARRTRRAPADPPPTRRLGLSSRPQSHVRTTLTRPPRRTARFDDILAVSAALTARSAVGRGRTRDEGLGRVRSRRVAAGR